MSSQGKRETASRILLEYRLRYHHRCLQEDATNPDLTALTALPARADSFPSSLRTRDRGPHPFENKDSAD
jgi:hypothetical protein